MKTPHLLAGGLSLAWPFILASSAFGQGDLNPPPGPPTPTMKTLDQVEARIIVNATKTPGDAANTFIINSPGSYYLTGNITGTPGAHGISIQANDVTLDLNGFALISGGGAGVRGVNVPVAQSGFSIRNGSVRGWTGGGVQAGATVTLAEKLRLSDNVGGIGLAVGNGSMIKDCVASGNATGFFAPDRTQVSNCIATVNTGVGFDCESFVNILDCTASRNGNHGIFVQASSSVLRCNSSRNIPIGGSAGGIGIYTGSGCTVADCIASSNAFHGIIAFQSSVTNCAANSNVFSGIVADGGIVAGSIAQDNGDDGIVAYAGSVTHCHANYNGGRGIIATGGSVANCRASHNGEDGIDASAGGSITNSTSSSNGYTGIQASQGSITNCVATTNGDHGIYGFQSVIAFCRASGNNQNNSGKVQIYGTGATLTGNNTDPAP